MKTLLLGAVALMAMAGTALADDLIGDWRTAADDNGNTGIIRITQCGASLCGTLVQAFDGSGASMQTDNIGRQIIWDTNPTGTAGEYRGMLYSPDRDRNYRSRLQLSGTSLSVSGCVMGGAVCREGGVWRRAN
ncbi:DUF2147 domain-containing protein [Rhodobacterales bacterium HKCCSP123]|nr:DUF2147 domain-containing protein [Rhodobacterales bacterium HKCCSP123]